MQTQKYTYTTFNNLKEGDVYFYGIIYDATYPTKIEDTGENFNDNSQIPTVIQEREYLYECTIKLIDTDVNCITQPNNFNDHVINLIIKSNSPESVPYIHSVGDIIRVHRGFYRHKKRRNVYLKIFNNRNTRASWCIFDGASFVDSKETHPKLCSHKNYSFEVKDIDIIFALRKFIGDYFTRPLSLFYPFEIKLKERVSGSDTVVQVVYKTELDESVVYFVQDETDGCELHAYKYFSKFIEVNDVIRVRDFKSYDKSVITMSSFSNILRIPQFTDYFKQFQIKMETRLKTISNVSDNNKLIEDVETKPKLKFFEQLLNHNVAITLSFVPPDMELRHFDEIDENENLFLIEVNIINIFPLPYHNIVNVLCPACNSVYFTQDIDLDNRGYFTCLNCKNNIEGKVHYNATLQCIEGIYTNKVLTLHLCTYDGEGEDFFGIKPVDFYRNPEELKKLTEKINMLTKRDTFVDVMIRKSFANTQDIYRIIGKYTSKV